MDCYQALLPSQLLVDSPGQKNMSMALDVTQLVLGAITGSAGGFRTW